MTLEWEQAVKDIEDHLFPRLALTIRQRALYYHLLRHTRIMGKENTVLGILPLARALAVSDSTVREDIRELHKKGCIQIEERSRIGHLVRVLLPNELDGILAASVSPQPVDLDSLDFFTDRCFVNVLLARENFRCFYCFRSLRTETCQLDHVKPQVAQGNNSYKNIVAACHECNTRKQGTTGLDFVRTLYRFGVLSQTELENRIDAIARLEDGNLIPKLEAP